MPGKLVPRKYVLSKCGTGCSINERNLPAGAPESIHRWYEQGANVDQMVLNAKAMGWDVSRGAFSRHKRNHLVPADQYSTIDPAADLILLDGEGPKPLSDLAILDKIVQAGSKQLNQQSVRITPEMTMKAMELRLRLTQGSVFDDFMAAVGQAFGSPDVPPSEAPEDPAAAATLEERTRGDLARGG